METDAVWTAIEKERLALADRLETLTPDQWDVPSLCAGWRVRDVVAHTTLAARARPVAAAVGMIRHRGFNAYVRADARAQAGRPPTDLVAELRRVAASRHHPPGTKPLDPLVDALVHGQDIAVPLGLDWEVPTEPAIAAADRVWGMGFPFNARKRLRGRRLVATDADWDRGDGPDVVEAPMRTLLLVLTGRPV